MKAKTKSKTKPSAAKPTHAQLTLQAIDTLGQAVELQSTRLDMVVERLDSEILSLRQQLDERAYTQALTPVEPKRPTLKWFAQEPVKIIWCINVDPATLVLTPGTTMRYVCAHNAITTYDGVTIGRLMMDVHKDLSLCISAGAKLHVYLTTERKLGIKLGRSA